MASTDLLYKLKADGSDLTRELKRGESGFKSFSKTADRALAGVASAATVAGTALVGLSVKAAGDFEQAIANAGAKSQATGDQLLQLSDAAKRAGIESAFGASEAAEALGFLAQAGLSISEQTAALPGVLDLASAGSLDLAVAADLATNALSGFGLGVDQLGRINDVLAKAANSANTSVEELGQALSFAAPTAAGLGVQVEEVAAFIGKLSDAGIKASRAGTSLNAILANMSTVAEKLGVKVTASDIATDGLAATLERLQKAGLSGQNALELFGREAGPGVAALLGQGIDSIRELETELQNAAGTAAEVAERQLDTFNGQMKLLQGSAETLAIALGQSLTPVLKSVAGEAISVTNELLENEQAMDRFRETVAGAVDDVGASLESLAPTLTIVTTSFGLVVDGVRTLDVLGHSLAIVVGTLVLRYNELNASLTGSAAATKEAERLQLALAKSGEELAVKLGTLGDATLKGVEVGEQLASVTDRLGKSMRDGARDVLNMRKALEELDTPENRARSGRSGYGRGGVRSGYGGDSRFDTDAQRIQKQLDEIDKREREAREAAEAAARQGTKRVADEVSDLADIVGEAYEDALREVERFNEEMLRQGARVFENTRTPLEAFNAELERLAKLLNFGAIDAETYLRAVDDLAERLRKATDTATETSKALQKQLFDSLDATGRRLEEADARLQERVNQVTSAVDDIISSGINSVFDEWTRDLEGANKVAADILRTVVQIGAQALVGRITQTALGGGSLPGFASGGLVHGPGTSTSDSILARLSTGEFVMREAAVARYGAGFFAKLNDLELPRFASGGQVGGEQPPMDVTIANFFDESEFERYLSSRRGGFVLRNALRRQQ